MANYLIEQLDNVINVINLDNDELLGAFGLDSTVQPDYGSRQYLNIYSDDVPAVNLLFTDSVFSTKDAGGVAVVFAGTYNELVNKINNEYFTGYAGSGGSGGGGDVTIVGDNVGLAKQITFDPKFTGYIINLDESTGDPFDSFPFNIEKYGIATTTKLESIEISDFKSFPLLNRIEDFISLLNTTQPYYLFVKVAETIIGVLDGELPANSFTSFTFIDDTNAATTLYEDLPYIVATDAFSTQDLILNELRYSNFLKSGSNGRKAVKEPAVSASAIAVTLSADNPYRKTITITNTSTYDLFVLVGDDTPTITDYKYLLPQNGVVIIDDTTDIVKGIWAVGADNGTALINVTY